MAVMMKADTEAVKKGGLDGWRGERWRGACPEVSCSAV